MEIFNITENTANRITRYIEQLLPFNPIFGNSAVIGISVDNFFISKENDWLYFLSFEYKGNTHILEVPVHLLTYWDRYSENGKELALSLHHVQKIDESVLHINIKSYHQDCPPIKICKDIYNTKS